MTEEQAKYGEHGGKIIKATDEALPVQKTSSDLLAMLVSQKADISLIEKFMDLRDREEAANAKRAYTEAMSAFKAKPPEIEKDAKVSYDTSKGKAEYTHATLGNVTNKINGALGEHGLSAAWKTEQADGGVTVTCTITHVMGHSESTALKAAPDTSGSKNPIQALGSTISYLERYTILALTGLATKDEDDDAAGLQDEFISKEQVRQINALIKGTDSDVKKFLKHIGADEVATIPAPRYQQAISALSTKVGQGKKKEKANDNN